MTPAMQCLKNDPAYPFSISPDTLRTRRLNNTRWPRNSARRSFPNSQLKQDYQRPRPCQVSGSSSSSSPLWESHWSIANGLLGGGREETADCLGGAMGPKSDPNPGCTKLVQKFRGQWLWDKLPRPPDGMLGLEEDPILRHGPSVRVAFVGVGAAGAAGRRSTVLARRYQAGRPWLRPRATCVALSMGIS